MEEQSHLIYVLKAVRNALKKQDYVEIKNLSNEIIHTASIEQDPDVISIAVVIYALSKIIERETYRQYNGWQNFYKNYTKYLNNCIRALENNNINHFRAEVNRIRELVSRLSGSLKEYIAEVFRKAEINKASRIYEHGISMEKTARILGISIWDLAEYVGGTGIADVNLGITLPLKERIKLVEDIFRK